MDLFEIFFRLFTIVYSFVLVTIMDNSLIESRFSKKIYRTATIVVIFACCAVIIIIYCGFGMGVMQRYSAFISTVPTFIFYYIMAKNRGSRFLLAFCTADLACMATIILSMIISIFLGGNIITILIARVFMLIPMTVFIVKYVSKPFCNIMDSVKSGWGAAAFVVILFYVLLYGYFIYPTSIETRPQDIPVGILIIVLLFSVYGFIYQTISNLNKMHQAQIIEQMLRLEITLQKEQYNAVQEKIKTDEAFRHDIRHHANMLIGMLNENKIEEARAYTQKLGAITLEAKTKLYSRNFAVNVILSSHLEKARKIGINVTCKAAVPQVLSIDEMELCILLSNIIENAVENCASVESLGEHITNIYEEKLPYLNILIIQNVRHLCIKVENSFNGEIKQNSRGHYISTKKNGGGIGLNSVRAIVEKHDGVMDINHSENIFKVSVVIKI